MVGGAVRNALLGEPIGEFDIATTAVPEEVIRRATAAGFKPVPTGIEHGTVTVVIDGRPFEVTTLREDVETFGRHANVRFGRDWRADAERRDFTMNALSVDRRRRRARLCRRACRSRSAARALHRRGEKRIAEDYLRILRFFRFHAAYGHGLPDAAGLAACIAARAGLAQLSRERVRMELLKLLLARHATPALAVMAESGLLRAGAGRRSRSRGLREHGQGRGGGGRAGGCGAAARRARRAHRRGCRAAVAAAAAVQRRARAARFDERGVVAGFAGR